MMSNETIEKLKLEFTELKNNVAEVLKGFGKKKMKFGEMMTSDGKMLSYEGESLAEGVSVMIDGAAPADGAYTLEDGTVCNVKDGKVESITAPQADEADFAEKFAAMEKRVADFESKFEETGKGFASQFEAIGTALQTLTEQMGKQLDLVGKFAAMEPEPGEKPANRKIAKMDKEASTGRKIEEILKEINNQK